MDDVRTNTDPMRAVVRAVLSEGRGSVVANWIHTRWYELELDCGHTVERTCRYERGASGSRRGWSRLHHPPPLSKVLDPPKRARCERCGADARRSASEAS